MPLKPAGLVLIENGVIHSKATMIKSGLAHDLHVSS